MHVEYDLDLLTAGSLPEHERRSIARARAEAQDLIEAQMRGKAIVAGGDDGGQTYFTIPANRVDLSSRALAQLLLDIDHLLWHCPNTVWLRFHDPHHSPGGGMGGHRVLDGLWLHDVIDGSALGGRIAEVLAGTRPQLWPNGSGPEGKPHCPDDMLDLLAEEDGRGPAFDLIESIDRRCRAEKDAALTNRAASAIHRFLGVPSARNRIQAALELIDRAEPEALVRAVYDGLAGTIRFPPWGCWKRFAGNVLGDLMRRDEPAAWAAFHKLASRPHWIRKHGQWIIVNWTEYDERLTDPRNFMEEIRTLRGRPRVRGIEESKLPAG